MLGPEAQEWSSDELEAAVSAVGKLQACVHDMSDDERAALAKLLEHGASDDDEDVEGFSYRLARVQGQLASVDSQVNTLLRQIRGVQAAETSASAAAAERNEASGNGSLTATANKLTDVYGAFKGFP